MSLKKRYNISPFLFIFVATKVMLFQIWRIVIARPQARRSGQSNPGKKELDCFALLAMTA
jgi:hypothetical protein